MTLRAACYALFLFCTFTSISYSQSILYVSENGSDTNPGTKDSPYKSIERALSDARSGQQIYVRAGTYNGLTISNVKGTKGSPIILSAAQGDEGKVLLSTNSHTKGTCVKINNSQHLVVRGFKGEKCFVGSRISDSEYIRLENNEFTSIGQAGIHIGGGTPSHFIEIIGNTISHTGKKSGRYGEGVYVGKGSDLSDTSSNVLIKDNDISHTSSEGIDIKANTSNIVVEGNNIHDMSVEHTGAITTGLNGKKEDNGKREVNNPSEENIVIRNNRIWNIRTSSDKADGNGINLYGGATVYNNVIWNYQHRGILFNRNTPAGNRFLIYNNTIFGGSSNSAIEGISTPRDGVRATITNNIGYEKGSNIAGSAALFNDWQNGDFRLIPGSAAIDAGSLNEPFSSSDLGGGLRPHGASIDLGAFEYGAENVVDNTNEQPEPVEESLQEEPNSTNNIPTPVDEEQNLADLPVEQVPSEGLPVTDAIENEVAEEAEPSDQGENDNATPELSRRQERRLDSYERRINREERRIDRYEDRIEDYEFLLEDLEDRRESASSDSEGRLLDRLARRIERRVSRMERRINRSERRISRLDRRIDRILGDDTLAEEEVAPPIESIPPAPTPDVFDEPAVEPVVQPTPTLTNAQIRETPFAPEPRGGPTEENPEDDGILGTPAPPANPPPTLVYDEPEEDVLPPQVVNTPEQMPEEVPEEDGCTIDWGTSFVEPQPFEIEISGVVEQKVNGSWEPIGEGNLTVEPNYTGDVVLSVDVLPSRQLASSTGRMTVTIGSFGVGVDQVLDADLSTCTPTGVPLPETPACGGSVSEGAIVVDFENHSVGTIYSRDIAEVDWPVQWTTDKMEKYAEISADEAQCGNQSLKATYTPGGDGGLGVSIKLPPEKEYYLSYWLYFAPGFDFDGSQNSGGKLPGLAADGHCSGGSTCNGSNGFTSRYMWREQGRAVLYLYHMDKPGTYGEDLQLKGEGGVDFAFQPGTWHHMVQRVKINDGGSRNGSIDVWVDGNPALSVEGLRFVTNGSLVDRFYLSSFFGGQGPTWQPDKTVNAYFDNFVISTKKEDIFQ